MQAQVIGFGMVFYTHVDVFSHSFYGQLFRLYVSGDLEVKDVST